MSDKDINDIFDVFFTAIFSYPRDSAEWESFHSLADAFDTFIYERNV